MIPPALLAIHGLDVRFGGLWALQGIDLAVHAGEVMAVIGPNGAGKTTLFNVISGLYAPTAGHLTFGGAPLRRALGRRHLAGFVAFGLCFGIASMLLAANLDRMWAVVIKQNAHQSATGVPEPFVLGDAWRAWTQYMQAAPHIERRMGRYHIVSYDGATTYGSSRDAGAAQAQLAQARIAAADEARAARALRWGVFVGGCGVGCAGALAVWRQSRRTPTWIARQGIARTFQNNRLFNTMTVLENVQVGLDRHHAPPALRGTWPLWAVAGFWGLTVAGLRWRLWPEAVSACTLAAMLLGAMAYALRLYVSGAFSPSLQDAEARRAAEASELLRFVGLEDQCHLEAASLAYGHQRRLEIARALATRPKLLLLDEPAAGMNHTETDALMELIARIKARGIAIMLIEHDMKLVMGISDRVAVLEYGRQIAFGRPAEVRHNPKVIAAYLGEDEVSDAVAQGV